MHDMEDAVYLLKISGLFSVGEWQLQWNTTECTNQTVISQRPTDKKER